MIPEEDDWDDEEDEAAEDESLEDETSKDGRVRKNRGIRPDLDDDE